MHTTIPRARRSPPVRLIDAHALAGGLTVARHRIAAERAFRLLGSPVVSTPPPLHLAGASGGVHVKAAALPGTDRGPALLVLKLNANFPANPARSGLPTIQGLALAFDGDNGTPLALLDSATLTAGRTAAACALAARTLALPGTSTATLVGCGAQAPFLLEHLVHALPSLERVFLHDLERTRAERLVRRMHRRLDVELLVAERLEAATLASAVIVTCTPSRVPFLARAHLADGAFVAALGADHPDKRELCDDLMHAATLVTDSRAQCRVMGEWHHVTGAACAEPAELGEILRGERDGRTGPSELVVFDSTGFALQDACAVEIALAACRGAPRFRFA